MSIGKIVDRAITIWLKFFIVVSLIAVFLLAVASIFDRSKLQFIPAPLLFASSLYGVLLLDKRVS